MTGRSPQPLRVVIADDHPFYRSGLARSLRAAGIEVVAEAPNGATAVRAVLETDPDVVVMDLNMPGMSGLDATRRLLEAAPGRRVLVLTVSADESDLAEAVLAGARGYVLKDRPVQEVVEAIRATAREGAPISPLLAMPLLRRLREPSGDIDAGAVGLDPVERRVLELTGEGLGDHEIATALGIGDGEVRAHASAILAKLPPDKRAKAALRTPDRRRA